MSNLLLDILKGGRTEINRLTDNNTSLRLTAGIGSVCGIVIILLIIVFYNNEKSKWNIPFMILFYISLYIIIISLGIGFLNLPLKTEIDTNLFVDNLTLIFRVLLIPVGIIIVLIFSKIPRDKGEGYFEYMITHLLQSQNLKDNIMKIGLLALPVVYGLIEVATNGGNFINLSTYYSSITGIIGIIIVVVMKLVGMLIEGIRDNTNITKNIEGKSSNIVAEVIVLFTTIITILTNMTQRVEGLIFSSIILLLMLFGIKLVSKTSGLIYGGIGLMVSVIIVQIFLQFTIFKQKNTTNINDVSTLEEDFIKNQKEILVLKAKINDTTTPTIIKMETSINKNEKYPVGYIDIIFNNYKHLTDKSKKNMENLVSIINQIDQNKSLAKDDREEQIYNKKLTNYNSLLDNSKIEERAILQQFVDNINKIDNLISSYNTFIENAKETKDALTKKNDSNTAYNKLKTIPTSTYKEVSDAEDKYNTANETYNKLMNKKYSEKYSEKKGFKGEEGEKGEEKVVILPIKQQRLNNLDNIYIKLDKDVDKKDSGLLDGQKANIDLILYCVSILGFVLGIKSIK